MAFHEELVVRKHCVFFAFLIPRVPRQKIYLYFVRLMTAKNKSPTGTKKG